MQFDRIVKNWKESFCNGKGQVMLIIIRAIMWIMRFGDFSLQIVASRHRCFSPLSTLRGSGGGMLHAGRCCGLIVSCFNILPRISFSRGWREGLITLTQDRSFSIFTFWLLWSHFLRDKCIGHSRYHGINPRVLFSTVWFLLCPSMRAWEMVWPTGSRAGNSKFWKALHFWPWHHY